MNATIVHYLALGDSYTIGEMVRQEHAFPAQLYRYIQASGISEPSYEILAKTGWTTRDVLEALDDFTPRSEGYDIITLLIGVNNQFQNKAFKEYEIEFTELVERSINLLHGKASNLIVISIPDYSVTPFANKQNSAQIAAEIDLYNDFNRKIATQKGARYVYITDLSRRAKTDKTLLASDQLHPSEELYKQWVHRILPILWLIQVDAN